MRSYARGGSGETGGRGARLLHSAGPAARPGGDGRRNCGDERQRFKALSLWGLPGLHPRDEGGLSQRGYCRIGWKSGEECRRLRHDQIDDRLDGGRRDRLRDYLPDHPPARRGRDAAVPVRRSAGGCRIPPQTPPLQVLSGLIGADQRRHGGSVEGDGPFESPIRRCRCARRDRGGRRAPEKRSERDGTQRGRFRCGCACVRGPSGFLACLSGYCRSDGQSPFQCRFSESKLCPLPGGPDDERL